MTCAESQENFSISVFHWYFTEAGATTSTLLNATAAAQHFGGGKRLHGFAQAHVVGQHDPPPAGGENSAALLVGQEVCLQNPFRGSRPLRSFARSRRSRSRPSITSFSRSRYSSTSL
jgi:hypothetical protein